MCFRLERVSSLSSNDNEASHEEGSQGDHFGGETLGQSVGTTRSASAGGSGRGGS